MRKDPALTYSGALAILGKHDRPTLVAIDRILGGLLLGGAPVATALVGLFDVKNEASNHVRGLLDAVADRLLGTAGHDRMELISAAHSVLVISSFFDALRDFIGRQEYSRLKLSRAEKAALLSADYPARRREAESLLEVLIRSQIPMPSARSGWHEYVDHSLRPYIWTTAEKTGRFLSTLDFWRSRSPLPTDLPGAVTETAIRRYIDDYHRLAADVPELFVWASLCEHAATRSAIRSASETFASLLDGQSRALDKLAHIVAAATARAPVRSLREDLAAINQAVLDKSVVATDALRHVEDVTFPSIRDGYVTPAFRVAVASRHALPSQEAWWSTQPYREDLDEFLLAYLGSTECSQVPLLVLGHPGAGKSLLTKVLAARLPPTAFAAVRVPLRSVEAGTAVHRQIEEVLERETNGRVSWPQLATESTDVTRVVLLDGLDELIQATGIARSDYIRQVAEFQQRELELKSPVAVILTSRTVVSDRAPIPDGSLMIKLEDFDPPRIERWLDVWRSTNTSGAESGSFRALSIESALHHNDLARQPLLLLMLALYAADPQLPDPGDQVLSVAGLYQRLLDNFVRRELRKTALWPLVPAHDANVANELWYLGLAAFGMFNRGRQHISEDELDDDMDRVIGSPANTPANTLEQPTTRAQRTVGKFFFVHSAEVDAHRQREARRTYEFLHATFGEYLIAATTMDLLKDAARRRQAARRSPFLGDAGESHLPALLSHQPFLKRRPIIAFAQELFSDLAPGEAGEVQQVLEELIAEANHLEHGGVFSRYNPSRAGLVNRLANYTVNLLSLRTPLTNGVAIANLAPAGTPALPWLQSTIRLWHAGLDEDGWTAAAAAFRTSIDPAAPGVSSLWLRPNTHPTPGLVQDIEGHIMASPIRAHQLHLGSVVYQELADDGDRRLPHGLDKILGIMLWPGRTKLRALYHELATAMFTVSEQTNPLLLACLARDAEHLPLRTVATILEQLLGPQIQHRPHLPDLARVIVAHPQLLARDYLIPLHRLASLAHGTTWTRLLTAALLDRPGLWPTDPHELAQKIGETLCQAQDFVSVFDPSVGATIDARPNPEPGERLRPG